MKRRLAVSIAIGAASALWCWAILSRNHQGAADFQWAIRLAQHLLAGQGPYDTPLEQYPPAAALLALPFVRLPGEIAGALFFGVSSGLLAFGLTRTGYTRLLIFFAYPYWAAMITAQWSPLVAASAFFWWLAPVALMKPNISLPVLLANLSRRAVIACGIVLAVSLALTLRWYAEWPRQLGNYGHFFPAAVFPGIVILLALFTLRNGRNKDALLLILASVVPQRWFYDAFILWLIPKSRREIIFTVAASWPVALLRWYSAPNMTQVGRWSVLGFYLPMLVVVLLRDEGVRARLPWLRKNSDLTPDAVPSALSIS